MDNLDEILEFVDSVHYQDRTALNKSLIHAFKRLLSSGKQVMVAEHNDNRQPRGDFASTSLMAGLGQAAKEAAAQAKPVVPFFQALKKLPVDRLNKMRNKLGGLSHKTLMKEHNGRPLHFWLAAIDGELGRREGATA